MTETPFANAVLLDQLLKLHGIAIDEPWQAGILANMAAIGRAADLVMGMTLDEAIEPAPVFQATAE